MYIKKIKINNIKSIEKVEFSFRNPKGWHVIIGENGSGKSTILKAVALALLDYKELFSTQSNWEEWIRYGTDVASISLNILKNYENIEVLNRVYFKSGDKTYLNKADIFEVYHRGYPTFKLPNFKYDEPKPKNLIAVEVTVASEIPPTPTPTPPVSSAGAPSAAPIPISSAINVPLSSNIKKYDEVWFSSAFGPYRRFSGGSNNNSNLSKSYPNLYRHISILGEDIQLSESLTFLKHQFLLEKVLLEHDKSKSFLTHLIKFINYSKILPNDVMINKIDENEILFTDLKGQVVNLMMLSDSYKSIICFILELLRQLIDVFGHDLVFENVRNDIYNIDLPGVVLIDEIDAHLHPTWQTSIGITLTTCFPSIQFIVTTHSPLICRAAENGTIWKVTSSGDFIEVEDNDRQKLIIGNILDAYGTELFGKSPVRSEKTNEKLERLGKLNMLSAFGKITKQEELERIELQNILQSDDSNRD